MTISNTRKILIVKNVNAVTCAGCPGKASAIVAMDYCHYFGRGIPDNRPCIECLKTPDAGTPDFNWQKDKGVSDDVIKSVPTVPDAYSKSHTPRFGVPKKENP